MKKPIGLRPDGTGARGKISQHPKRKYLAKYFSVVFENNNHKFT
jgi:hypothetical protein